MTVHLLRNKKLFIIIIFLKYDRDSNVSNYCLPPFWKSDIIFFFNGALLVGTYAFNRERSSRLNKALVR